MRRLMTLATTAALLTAPLGMTAAPAQAAPSTLAANTWVAGKVAAGSTGVTYRFTPPSSGYYLVTLGDLSADYALTVRTPAGGVKAVVDRHGAGAFEERPLNLTEGKTYTLTVGSKNAPGTYALRALRMKAGVRTLERMRVRSYVADEGSDITMRVFNNTDRYQQLLHPPMLDYFDAGGHKLTNAAMSEMPVWVLAPHTLGYVHLDNTPLGWKSTRMVDDVVAEPTSDRPLTPSAVSTTATATGAGAWDVVVTNKTSKDLYGTVNYLYFDRRGRLVNVADKDGTGTGGIFSVSGKADTDDVSIHTNQATTATVSVKRRLVYVD